MQQFIEKFGDQIMGVLTGFDRLVFRGSLRRLNYGWWDNDLKAAVATGTEQYLWQNRVLFKDYRQHVKRVSERLKKESLKPFEEQGFPVVFLRSPSVDKDELARRVAVEKGIRTGLVCAISALEPSPTFEHRGTHIIRRIRPCGVHYQYQIHPEVGWMYSRVQTWFPFNVQVRVNGREWLARQMDQEKLPYRPAFSPMNPLPCGVHWQYNGIWEKPWPFRRQTNHVTAASNCEPPSRKKR